ncbi:hypothetical protein AB0D78_28100 [Streptomyces avermitilis]|uniref:hypothetical protein n=1 Tax=Streptomyces avermitilis TaxID=33903 RepID=UPI0033D259C2
MATQCKLYTNTPQLIQPQTWTTVRYDEVLRDDAGMFRAALKVTDRNAALITPKRDGDFIWFRFLHWDDITVPDGDTRPRQFIERFVRDPYTEPDSTGSADTGDTPGKEYRLGSWAFAGHAGQPVAVQVWHDHDQPVAIVHAQFVGMTWDY